MSTRFSLTGIEIEINHDCNRTCPYCPNSKLDRPSQGRMSESQFTLILEQLKTLGYRGRISYHFYNEPLYSPDFERFVALTRGYLPACRTELYTNGTLLDEERFLNLIKIGVDKFTVTKHQGVAEIPLDHFKDRLSPEQLARIKYQKHYELIMTSRGGLMPVGRCKLPPPQDLPCFIPSSVMIIAVSGNVLPCFEDYLEQNVMGNVFESDLLSIWNSEKYQTFRMALKQKRRGDFPVCRNCNCTLILS